LHGDAPNRFFGHLTRRANQGHIIIADIAKLAPVNRLRAFLLQQCYARGSFKLSNLFHCIFGNLSTVRKTFDTSGKSPAHYHHRESHAEPGRRNPLRAFLLEFSNRTAAA